MYFVEYIIMTSILKKSFLLALACVCVGAYGVVEAQGATDAQTKVSGPLEMSVEAAVPGRCYAESCTCIYHCRSSV